MSPFNRERRQLPMGFRLQENNGARASFPSMQAGSLRSIGEFFMSVELWYGKKPNNYGEQSVLTDLYDYLRDHSEHFIMLSSFHAGKSGEIDLVILNQNAVFMIELKHSWNKLTGGRDGDWTFLRNNGGKGSFTNPYRQIRSRCYRWDDWVNEGNGELKKIMNVKKGELLSKPFQYVVIYPEIHPDSNIDVGIHPVQVMSLSKFRTELMIRRKDRLTLSRKELQAIPQLLKLKRWHIEPPSSGDETVKLNVDDFQQPNVRMLVPRGHTFSKHVFYINKETLIVGRDPSCEMVINDASISRKHAMLRKKDGRWIVEDLDSENGTYVSFNGDPQFERKAQVNALKNGSIVRFGEAGYTFLLSEESE